MRIKIAIYLKDLLGGGVEKRMLILAEELVKRNYDIDLLLERATGVLLKMVPEGVSIIILSDSTSGSIPDANPREKKNKPRFLALVKQTVVKAWYTLLWKIGIEYLYRSLRIMLTDFIKYRYNLRTARLYYLYLTKLNYGRMTPEITTNLTGYIKQNQPRIIITGLEDQNFRLIIAKHLSGSRAKCVISVRNHLTTYFPLCYNDSWHRNYRFAVQYLYPKADKIIAVSKEIKKDIEQQFGINSDHVEVIYNPVINDDVQLKCTEPTDDDDWLNADIPILLSVGRLHPQKGFDSLIRAFSLVLKKMSARLIILGEGQEEKKLKDIVRELGLESRIRFSGFIENPFPYMAKSSLFVLSSKNEGLPGALIESMACGCPVVATDCHSGPNEILEAGKWGILVPVGDTRQLAEAIITAINKEHDKSKLRERANYFKVEKSVDHYIRVFDILYKNETQHAFTKGVG